MARPIEINKPVFLHLRLEQKDKKKLNTHAKKRKVTSSELVRMLIKELK